ncbi:MAG: hypothetical protein ACJASR_001345 [Psychroserpens sp.]|jgi:hypothetical protein
MPNNETENTVESVAIKGLKIGYTDRTTSANWNLPTINIDHFYCVSVFF